MRKLLSYLKQYKKEAILGPIFKLTETIFDLAVPIIFASLIDNGILKSDNNYIIKMTIVLVVLALFGIIVALIAQYFAAKASVGLGTKIRENLFKHIQTYSFKELDQVGESTIINRIMNDTLQVQNGVNLFLKLILRSPAIVFGSLIMAFLIDVRTGIIFAIVIPIIVLIVFVITKICVPKYTKIQNHKDELLNITQETLTGARVIRAFETEDKQNEQFEKENTEYTKLAQNASKISSMMNSLNYVMINFGIVAIIAVGGKQVDTGILTQGQVVALYNYMAQILIELIKLTNLLLIIPKTIASAGRINEMFGVENSVKSGSQKLESDKIDLKFEDVCLKYTQDGNEALSNINFEIQTGQTLGIVGGTGSGKTSIINLIPRFYDATSGKIEINDKDIEEYDVEDLRKNISIVMQNKVLFSGTIKDNIEFGNRELDERELANALNIAQASEIIKNKENGLEEKVEENGRNFSGGQKQRLTISRAIAREPKILILDDSMSALDLLTDKKLIDELEKIKKDKILIIVSQRISTIKDLDKIIVVDNGKIVGQGKHEELLRTSEVYKEINDSQMRRGE